MLSQGGISDLLTESSFFSLAEGTTDIWLMRLDEAIFTTDDHYDVLSDDEIQTASRYVFVQDRHRFVRCRLALRKILACYLGLHPSEIEFSYSRYGKPFIDRSPVRFNLSHSRDIALIAVTMRQEIGVDIEFVDPGFDFLSVASFVFSDAELDQLKLISTDAEQLKYFYTGWTRKEAVLKAIGQGFSTPLEQQREISKMDKNGEVVFTSNMENNLVDWSLNSLVAPDNYVAALSVEGKMGIVRHRRTSDIRGLFAARLAA